MFVVLGAADGCVASLQCVHLSLASWRRRDGDSNGGRDGMGGAGE